MISLHKRIVYSRNTRDWTVEHKVEILEPQSWQIKDRSMAAKVSHMHEPLACISLRSLADSTSNLQICVLSATVPGGRSRHDRSDKWSTSDLTVSMSNTNSKNRGRCHLLLECLNQPESDSDQSFKGPNTEKTLLQKNIHSIHNPTQEALGFCRYRLADSSGQYDDEMASNVKKWTTLLQLQIKVTNIESPVHFCHLSPLISLLP